jgi:hypothetical protein
MDSFLEKLTEHNGYLPPTSNFIITNADKLVECVDMAGEINMQTAARALDMSMDQIYDWVLVMEKKNLLKLRYSLLRGIILVSSKVDRRVSLWNWL